MLVRSRDLAGRISTNSQRHLGFPLTPLAAKPAKLSVRSRRMALRRSLRIGGHFPTVR